ncbi:OV-16 antigen-like [Bemisia tabaci]|uniref:OV-16 antigen-like n=1 Tax=Bemisia tabaci TaxID=7038 RepID=UPI003B2818CB
MVMKFSRSFGFPSAGYKICLAVILWNIAPSVNGNTTPHHSEPQNGASKNEGHESHEPHNPTPTIVSHVTTPNTPRIQLTLPPIITPAEVKQKLEDLLVIPDVIHDAPLQRVDVTYKLGLDMHFANMGNVIHEDIVSKPPILLYWRWNPGEYFTVIVTGPDVPNSELPTDGEWRHWIVMNIPGNDVTKGRIVRDYVGFRNETALGIHRMVFLVFKQPRPFIISPEIILRNSTSAYRGFFSTRNFVRMHHLVPVPVAANFILVNCTNIIHDPVAWAAVTTHQTTCESREPTTVGVTTQRYEYTAQAEEVTEDKKPK